MQINYPSWYALFMVAYGLVCIDPLIDKCTHQIITQNLVCLSACLTTVARLEANEAACSHHSNKFTDGMLQNFTSI